MHCSNGLLISGQVGREEMVVLDILLRRRDCPEEVSIVLAYGIRTGRIESLLDLARQRRYFSRLVAVAMNSSRPVE